MKNHNDKNLANIILVDSVSDLNVIPTNLLNNHDTKIFSLNFEVHNNLQSRKILHVMADSLLKQEERLQIFDKGVEFLSWHSKVFSKDLEFEGINLLKMSDSDEFLSYIMPNLTKLVTIKRIIEKEKPTRIIATSPLSNMIKSIINEKNIETKFFHNTIETKLFWDKITIKYNIGRIPISFNLSKNKYLKLKKFVESIIGLLFDFWLDINSQRKKSIIFLEFNTEYFSKLLHAMKNYDGNVILINRRRSSIWSRKAIDIVRKSNCRVLNLDKILNEDEKQRIPLLVAEYSKRFTKFWNNSDFNNVFQIENCMFWNVIKEVMIETYSKKLEDFFYMILISKKILHNFDVRCIISLNEIGETENAFLECNNKKHPSILLEHGFVERIPETERFDKLAYVDFRDKIAVWGEMKKKYLITKYGLDPSKIIVTGSPRHDDYFNATSSLKRNKTITLLLAPNPINPLSGLETTELKLQLHAVIEKIILMIKKLNDVRIVVKLHGIQLKHNEEILSLIKKIDNKIPIYLSTSIIEIINHADVVVVLSAEIHATSTMLFESMILQKPTMNIVINDKIPEFNFVKNKAVLTLTNKDDLEEGLKQILYDINFQNELKENAKRFVNEFLANPGNASEKFASILKSF